MTNSLSQTLDFLYLSEQQQHINELFNRDSIRLEIIKESFTADKLDSIKKSFEKNIEIIPKFLLKYGINVNRVKEESKKLSEEVKRDLKEKKDPKIIQDKITHSCFQIVKTEFNSAKETFYEMSLSDKIILSLMIFTIVLVLNTVILVLFSSFFGPELGMMVLSLILGPVIEESAKRYAIKENYPWVYTGIFAGLELLDYVIKIVFAGGLLIPALIVRISTLMMHFATTAVQKYFHDKDELEGNQDSTSTNIGYILAIFIHVTWNIVGTIFNKQIGAFVGLKV